MSDQAIKLVAAIRAKSDAEAAALLSKLLTAARDRGAAEAKPAAAPSLFNSKIPQVPFINFGEESAIRDSIREVDGQGAITVAADVMARILAEVSRLRGCRLSAADPYNEVPPTPGVGLRPGFSVATANIACRVWGAATAKERIDIATTLVEGTGGVVAVQPQEQAA